MQYLPLLFTFKQVVGGIGFIADVRMSGRALLEDDQAETWIKGVAPAGFAGGGSDRNAAFIDFRKAWAEILFDIAEEAGSFKEFKQQAEDFLSSSIETFTNEWRTALDEVRLSGHVDPTLRRESADEKPVAYDVVEIVPQKYGLESNEVEAGLKAAA